MKKVFFTLPLFTISLFIVAIIFTLLVTAQAQVKKSGTFLDNYSFRQQILSSHLQGKPASQLYPYNLIYSGQTRSCIDFSAKQNTRLSAADLVYKGVFAFPEYTEGNDWNCWTGCGGGSVIDFWTQWRECDFTTAVRELAGMAL